MVKVKKLSGQSKQDFQFVVQKVACRKKGSHAALSTIREYVMQGALYQVSTKFFNEIDGADMNFL